MKKILLTGCAGFIGGHFIRKIAEVEAAQQNFAFHIVDALTTSSNYESIQPSIQKNPLMTFEKMDIRNPQAVHKLFQEHQFIGALHFAAESHVDKSIEQPNLFVETNVLGTAHLLQQALFCTEMGVPFRFLHVSTDEVYGSLNENEFAWTTDAPLKPNSPYSATKAAADLLCHSYWKTYNLDIVITRSSNNFGSYQALEKFIPVIIQSAVYNQPIPVYGNGLQIRDWISVHDNVRGVWEAFKKGQKGAVYHFGSGHELRNIDLVKIILKILNKPESLIHFVKDRPGHDFRYSLNTTQSEHTLDWKPQTNFMQALTETVKWYEKKFLTANHNSYAN